MKSLFEHERKVYMVGCGNLEDACKVYDMKPNSKDVDIVSNGTRICTYSRQDMQQFLSLGYAILLN